MKKAIGVVTAGLALAICVFATAFLFGFTFGEHAQQLPDLKDRFTLAVNNTLVPLFNSVIAAVLAYVFGKPIMEALARRIG